MVGSSIARGILDQARPIFVGQVAVMFYAVVDTVLTGHASATDLAAMGLGTGVYSSVFVASWARSTRSTPSSRSTTAGAATPPSA
jgi:Na+-driven multidrug efflux pump